MSITKETVVSKMEILEDGQIQVRESVRFIENGNVVAESFHRKVLTPEDDFTNEDSRVKAVAQIEHTPQKRQAFRDKMAAKESKRAGQV